jgi:hypothetical protein
MRFSKDWAVPVTAVLCVGPLLNSGRSAAGDTRIEHDSLGDLEIPNNQYHDVQTSRALETFHSTPRRSSISPTSLMHTRVHEERRHAETAQANEAGNGIGCSFERHGRTEVY